MQHCWPFMVMQLPLEPPQASSLALTAPLVGCLASVVNGPGVGPLRPRPQGILEHTAQPQAVSFLPSVGVVSLRPSPLYDRDWNWLVVELKAVGKFSM